MRNVCTDFAGGFPPSPQRAVNSKAARIRRFAHLFWTPRCSETYRTPLISRHRTSPALQQIHEPRRKKLLLVLISLQPFDSWHGIRLHRADELVSSCDLVR